MIRNLTLTTLFLVFASFSWGKSGILGRIITVDIKSTPVKTILTVIEQRADVQFSYNPDLIEENRIVSLRVQKKTIAFGLSLIFNKTVRFKEVGNHIILLRNEDAQVVKERKKSDQNITFKGNITDKRTGQPVADVSIYDVDARNAAVSDPAGNYSLTIPTAEVVRSLYIRKKGYKEYVFVVDASSKSQITKNIALEPDPQEIEKLATTETQRIYMPIEERALSGGLVSYDTYVHAENLEEIEESRMAQISLVPSVSIGSNLSTNGLITNNFSLNLLAGYSSGVNGAEIGGITNLVNGDVRWFQAAGIFNLVGGTFSGFQTSGIANSVRGDAVGMQSAGISNLTGGNFKGYQAAGIVNYAHRNFKGFQSSGISSFVVGQLTGFQASGIFSAVRCGFNGLQASGIANVADSLSMGLQISGIHNSSFGTLHGAQFAGISNFSNKGRNFLQVSGIANMAGTNNGLQAAGIFNFAKKNAGLQVGLINTSIEGNGFTLGLFNFVLKGFHKTEVSINESFPLNVTFKSGVRRFYNTYNFGIKFGETNTYAGGLGFGTNFTLKGNWQMSCDVSAQLVFENNFSAFEFGQLYKFNPSVEYKLAKWVTVFAGPSVNVNVLRFANEEGFYESDLGPTPLYDEPLVNGRLKMWLGGQFGFRF